MIKRINKLFRRNLRAYKLKIPLFLGMAHFKTPSFIAANKKKYKINFPLEDYPTADQVFTEIFLDDCYNLNLIKHPIKTILDIGANMGFSSLYMSILFKPDLIVAYEPNPALIEIIKQNLVNQKIVIKNQAVGSKKGKVNLVFTERVNNVVSALTKTKTDDNGDTDMVAFSNIVQDFGGQIDLVKMDCEGGEWSFIKDESWKNIKYLTMEYHLWNEGENKDELYKALNKNFVILKEDLIDDYTGMILAKNKSI